MIKDKYLQKVREKISQFNQEEKLKFFIFGSSLIKDHFGDVDIGIMGNVQDEDVYKLKEEFIESTFPYFVNIINFNKVSEKFKNNVFNNKILWLTR